MGWREGWLLFARFRAVLDLARLGNSRDVPTSASPSSA